MHLIGEWVKRPDLCDTYIFSRTGFVCVPCGRGRLERTLLIPSKPVDLYLTPSLSSTNNRAEYLETTWRELKRKLVSVLL